MSWLNLQDWGKAHGMSSRAVKKLIDDGIIGAKDYIHNGHLWRVNPDAEIHNPVAVRIAPSKCSYLDELNNFGRNYEREVNSDGGRGGERPCEMAVGS